MKEYYEVLVVSLRVFFYYIYLLHCTNREFYQGISIHSKERGKQLQDVCAEEGNTGVIPSPFDVLTFFNTIFFISLYDPKILSSNIYSVSYLYICVFLV